MMRLIPSLLLTPALLLASAAHAQSFSDTLAETFAGETKLNLNLYGFAADVDGHISNQQIKYKVDQPFSDTIHHLDKVFMGHLDLSKGRWGVYLDKQLVKTSESKKPFNIPVAINTRLDQTSYGAYYQAYRSPETTQRNLPRLVIEPTVGVHYTKADAKLAAFGQSIKGQVKWHEIFWGARARYNFDSPWNLAAEATTGEHETISVHAYVGYNIPVFERHLNLRVGYRYFRQDYRANNFHWDVRQRGPVIGINLPIF